MASWLRGFFEALRFLTIVPVPWLPSPDPDFDRNLARSLTWTPFVGLLLGLVGLAVGHFATVFWPHAYFLRAALIVFTWACLTGGLHLDGLADTFDAVMSHRSRERMLEIMKDSRIGAMGALALVGVLSLKVFFIAAAGNYWWLATLLAPMLGRWANLVGIFCFPPAREGGLGRGFQAHTDRQQMLVATLLLFWLPLLLLVGSRIRYLPDYAPPVVVDPVGLLDFARFLVATALVAAVSGLLAWRWTRLLGGLTGDTYGALTEIGECVALAALGASALG